MNKVKMISLCLGLCFLFSFELSAQRREVTPEQRQEERFAKFDQNNDGVVDLAELKKALEGKKNKDGEPVDAEKFLARKDLNKDGKLDKKEFMQHPKHGKKTHGHKQKACCDGDKE